MISIEKRKRNRPCVNCGQEIKISFTDPLAICCLNCKYDADLNRAALYKEWEIDVTNDAEVTKFCTAACQCNIMYLMEGGDE